MEMYVAGQWTQSANMVPVRSPNTGQTVDTVPAAAPEQVEAALAAAEKAAVVMGKLPAHERYAILMRAAALMETKVEDLACTITLEQGKPIAESRGEAGRMPEMLRLCAFEGAQIRGETLPVDAQAGIRDKLALTVRVPCGVVLAISPFNYPLSLVMHKVGPALAGGNAVILKPASQTPLVALKLTGILLEAGLPENGLQCVTGAGSAIGNQLCADRRVRKISFTGSSQVGEAITRVAGVKKLSLELGSNSPLVILSDADVEAAAQATAVGGFANAGQACISVQRVLVGRRVYADYLDALKPKVEAIKAGDPFAPDTRLCAMTSEKDALRVEEWIREAVAGGARLVTGGRRDKAFHQATIVADAAPGMRISCEELFGPAVAVTPVDGLDEALALANDSSFGLGAGLFTRDIGQALRFAREMKTGNVMINSTSRWRADLQPYGGFKQSGIGKEGPRYALEEMTEIKTIVFHQP